MPNLSVAAAALEATSGDVEQHALRGLLKAAA